MPTLQFKGRNIIWNHHLTVPYHTLDEDTALSFDPKKGDGNIIVEGDNLTALKALLPQYAGKIKCIYIDPPYNTGNEGWVYNDKVNSPLINEWLGKTVGTDDLTRHDKWLCMMVPRLKMLRELLSDDGGIFISIDDNEVQNLKIVMDEIFGAQNFISTIVCQLNPRGRTLDKYLAKTHEYILLYSKSDIENDVINLLEKEGKAVDQYSKKDEKGEFRELELRNRNPVFNRKNRPNLYFPIYINPNDNTVSLKKSKTFSETSLPLNSNSEDGCWTWSTDKVSKNLDLLIGKQVSTGFWRVYRKDYLYNAEGEIAKTKAKALWIEKEINNENGKEIVKELFGSSPFDFPKSVELLKKIIQLSTNENDIILDSFAGSGTTGQAVLELNKEDGGNRKFILVQMTEASNAEPDKNIAKDITAERIKRAITKYDLNSGFTYYKLGTAIDAETLLQGDLPTYEQFAKYVYYLCTGQHHSKPKEIKPKDYFVGNAGNTAIYLIYEQDFEKLTQLALNLSLAEKFRKASANKPVVVYAPACFLDEEYLQDFNMQFVSIPYNLFQKNEQP